MIALFWLLLALSVSPFKSKNGLAAENAALRHQLIVLQRRVRGRVQLTNGDRLFLVLLYRWFPSVLRAITIIRPETLGRWHRAGFRHYWRCSLTLANPTMEFAEGTGARFAMRRCYAVALLALLVAPPGVSAEEPAQPVPADGK